MSASGIEVSQERTVKAETPLNNQALSTCAEWHSVRFAPRS
jgi:hypothetical protein